MPVRRIAIVIKTMRARPSEKDIDSPAACPIKIGTPDSLATKRRNCPGRSGCAGRPAKSDLPGPHPISRSKWQRRFGHKLELLLLNDLRHRVGRGVNGNLQLLLPQLGLVIL